MSEPLQFGGPVRETLSDPIVLLVIAVGAATAGYQLGAVAAGASASALGPAVIGLTVALVALLHATDG